ncbi:MAG: type II restriction endonuclease [Bacteroidia bacterium]|nr:type II restriction endonuclease [Bacteroidia bacterium]
MSEILQMAIDSVQTSKIAYSKFITANDTGDTGGHQSGYHIHKNAWPLFFETPGRKGENKDNFISITWQGDIETDSRAIYYGKGTRNEYRLTRFGKEFPFLTPENVGDLLVMCKIEQKQYNAWILQSDEDIEDFLAGVNISPSGINKIIPKQDQLLLSGETLLFNCFQRFIGSTKEVFPSTYEIATNARNCFLDSFKIGNSDIRKRPSFYLLMWIEAEYSLFKMFENDRYSEIIETPFKSVEKLVEVANTILNRRKSRAGRSLELHLEEVFSKFELIFETQAKTEGKKKPDFLFPGSIAYKYSDYKDENLTMLAAKTTCKDRWRQILNEADKIKTKHLFTLQAGISVNQLQEMENSHVKLVVPKQNKSSFPRTYQDKISTLEEFISLVKNKQL